MLYKSGWLEVNSDVRSVPLGAKRKRGRPKKLPNCLARSPVRPAEVLPLSLDVPPPPLDIPLVASTSPQSDLQVPGVRKTTRKRKRCPVDDLGSVPEPDVLVQQSPVHALHTQAQALKPGLGSSKPPKKKGKTSNPEPNKLPPAVICKKKTGTCKHEVVFGKHYDRKAWNMYAAHVHKQKSSVHIDPNYIP